MKKMMLLAMGLCVSLLLWNCKGQTTTGTSEEEDSVQVDNPLKVAKPTVVKFVRVVADESTEVFMEADAESPWRVIWMEEDSESDMMDVVEKWSNEDVPDGYSCDEAPAYAGTVLAVLGEEGDFYKVSIRNELCFMEAGYVKKADVADVEPEKLTDEEMEELEGDMDWIHLRMVKEGKYKGLVLRCILDELKGECFDVGVMLDGVLAFPEENSVFIDYSPDVQELTFMGSVQDGQLPFYFQYPKSMARWSEDDYPQGFDLDKLTDEQIERIVQDMLKQESEYVKYDFLIPMTEGGVMTFWLKSK